MPRALGAASGATGIAELGDNARTLVQHWRDGQLGSDDKGRALGRSLREIGAGAPAGASLPDWYLPVMSEGEDADRHRSCWARSQVTAQDLPTVLFWLDLLSTTEQMALTSFSRNAQILLLEVALDPSEAAACARQWEPAASAASHSVYMAEIRRNPDFIRFITRALSPFDMDVAGISLQDERYVLTEGGRKLMEGAAPSQANRIAVVGELGALIQSNAGLSVSLFRPDLAWRSLP